MDGAFQTLILQLVDRAHREKWALNQFNYELDKLLLSLNIDANNINKIKAALLDALNFVNSTFIGIITQEQINQMISYFNWKTIKTTEEFKKNLGKAFIQHIDDLNYKELRNKISHLIATKKHYSETIMNTALAGIDNITSIAKKTSEFMKHNPNKVPKFKYVGPPAERAFCKHHLGNIYTLPEIQAMENGQGLPVISNGGGYNCRHHWVLVD